MAKKSKWIDNKKFREFVNQKRKEKNEKPDPVGDGYYLKWRNPQMGTQTKAKVYKIRLLPDKDGEFYKKYFYHFFQTNEKSYYIKCNKTADNLDNYCPWCNANQILWKGNENDKKKAYRYKRNERFVCNVFIVDDPRDVDADNEFKVNGKLRLYEFPATIESKIINELTDDEQGYGEKIFDPENGHDLFIKIKAHAPDKNGKIWPDYADTAFSKVPTAILEEKEEIEKTMDSVYDLSKYLKSLDIDWKTHEKLIKQELLWDDIKENFMRNVEDYKESEESEKEESEETASEETETEETETEDNDDEPSDEDLLNELKKINQE